MPIRPPLYACLAVAVAFAGLAAAAAAGEEDERPRLEARAVLPADTIGEGPVSGAAIGAGPFDGRTPPFAGQPVQCFSALIEDGRHGRYLTLSDNGYGAKASSADFLLRAQHISPDFRSGTVRLLGSLIFSDRAGSPVSP